MLFRKISFAIILVASTFLLMSFVNVHELDMASFTFNLKQDSSNLIIIIDIDDFENSIYKSNNPESKKLESTSLTQLAESYFEANLEFIVNNKSIEFSEITKEKKTDHYIFTLDFKPYPFPIKTIEIQNTCLMEEVDGQNNIVTIKYNDGTRDFRMHKKRTLIQLQY